MYLAASGVGEITLVDADIVDLTNLQRQILHVTGSVGGRRSNRAATRSRHSIPASRSTRSSAAPTPRGSTKTCRAQPSCSTAPTIRDAPRDQRGLRRARRAARFGRGAAFHGQISTFDFRSEQSPCYACVFPPDQAFEEVACSTMGVFAPTVGIIGAMQAAEALRVIGGFGETLAGRLMMLDSLRMEWNTMRIARQPGCPVCGTRRAG